MAEAAVEIPVGDIVLEGRYEEGGGSEGALICHPHPLYGGDMDNNVVLALRRALRSSGASTIRFNFRGVGGSGGEYGDGEAEVDDVAGAAAFLAGKGKSTVHVAAYSFGAWVALKSIRRGLKAASCLLVSPPIDFLRFSELRLPGVPCLVTLGDRDTFCSVPSLKNWIARQGGLEMGVSLEILAGVDHFYAGSEGSLEARVARFLSESFRTRVV